MISKRVCRTCGATYDYCPGCAKSAGKPEWMLLWDSEECKNVFESLTAYNLEKLDAEGVKDALKEAGVTSYDKYVPRIRKQLQKIVPAAELKQQRNMDVALDKKM